MDETTSDVVEALVIAREMIEAGIPIFAAPPCPSGPFGDGAGCTRPGHGAGGVEYDLPARWQQTVPSAVWLDRWQPGWALAAVGGWAADFLDEDPRNGGDASAGELAHAGAWPEPCAVQVTPSGGHHYMISPLRERKVTGLLPGLDYQGGAADGQGRGFVWIAPTVKRSKSDGQARAYVWVERPALNWLAEFDVDPGTGSADPSIDGLRLRIVAHRQKRGERTAAARQERGSAERVFTPAQMEHFLAPVEREVRAAAIGEIEERANAYACALSHFVPAMLTAEQAFDRLTAALGETAYDPAHPASQWEAEKFVAVISDIGGRAPADWHAVVAVESMDAAVAAVDPQGDAVSALLAEMLTADELASRKPPRYVIDGLLQFDSESWLIGEPGSRKSFVALDMAAHVATGQAWQGHRVNQALVAYIVAEGAGGSAVRVQAWQKRYGDMGQGIRFLPRPVQAGKPEAWAVLVQACARLATVARESGMGLFVVLDTQARVTVGLKENDATDMGVYVDAVRAIREASGACVLTIHHTGRRGGDARGSSAIDGAQTTELKVIKDVGSNGGLYGRVITEKQKDIEEAPPVLLKFEAVDLGQDDDGRPVGSLVLVPDGQWRIGEVDEGTAERAGAADEMRKKLGEPGEWTTRIFDHQSKVLARRILQALGELGGEHGRTEASLRKAVVQTWYPRGEGRGAGKLRTDDTETGWVKAWRQCLEARLPGGETVVTVMPGPRYTVDPLLVTDE